VTNPSREQRDVYREHSRRLVERAIDLFAPAAA
jgi:hypothetical protein